MSHDDNQTKTSRLVARCLAQAATHFENLQASGKGFNISGAQGARDAAILLGLDGPAARLDAILKPLTVADSLKGAIINFKITPDMRTKPLPRRTMEELERAYPPFPSSYAADLLSKGGVHLQPCLERNYEQAMAKATCELDEVEVCFAQALLGDFEAARASVQRFPNRNRDMSLVLAIELYRRGRIDEADKIAAALLDQESTWTPTHIALGVSGRVPWPHYPFPVY